MKKKNVLVHAFVWSVFISFEVLALTAITGTTRTFWSYFFSYAINIGLFYLNSLFVLPFSFASGKKLFLLPLLITAETGLYLFFMAVLGNFLRNPEQELQFTLTASGASVLIYRGMNFMIYSTGYWLAKRIIRKNRDIADLEKEKLQESLNSKELEQKLAASQNAWLRARLNPHLLFNTLVFLQDTVYGLSKEAEKGIGLLSEIVHFSLAEPGRDGKVKLADEIEHIRHYLELQALCSENKLYLRAEFPEQVSECRIIPLALLSLTENIFKHGNLADENYEASLQIREENGRLEFISQNAKKAFDTPGYGLGISGNRIRLDNFYKGNYSLSLKDHQKFFEVHLIINL